MKLLLVAGIIGLSIGVAAAKPNAVADLYEQLYPSDHAKRQALELCFLANRQFNRLDPDEREARQKSTKLALGAPRARAACR